MGQDNTDTKGETKGFNDDELADIMKEIEGLEQEFAGSSTATKKADPIAEEIGHPVAAAEDMSVANESMQSTDLAESNYPTSPLEEDTSNSNLVELKQRPATTSSMSAASSSPVFSTLDFKVSGDLAINLKFNFGNEAIELVVDAKQGLIINLQNGAQFKVPLTKAQGYSRKAS